MADSLAKWAASTAATCGSIPLDTPHTLATSGDTPHLWTQSISDSHAATMPRVGNGFLEIQDAVRKVERKVDKVDASQIQVGEFACKVVTYNAQSIREDKKNQKLCRREAVVTSRLDSQWHNDGAAIVGIQETRTPEGTFRSKHYEIFSSGADESHDCPLFGCEVWLHSKCPIIQFQGRSLFSSDFKKTVIHKDPRRLIVKCKAEPLTLVVASLHAPCLSQKTDVDRIKQWWNDTCLIFEGVKAHAHIVCVDANAPLGSEVTNNIGSVGEEPSNQQGDIVQEAVERMEWCVPSTFEGCHHGSSATWRHLKVLG